MEAFIRAPREVPGFTAEEILEDLRAVAGSCGAYLHDEEPERAAEIEARAAELGIDLADGAARNAMVRAADAARNGRDGAGQVIS